MKPKQLKAELQTKDLQDKEDIRAVLNTPEGRRLLWDLLTKCGVFHQSFSDTAERTAFNEGKRWVGLSLLDKIVQTDPRVIIEMMKGNL